MRIFTVFLSLTVWMSCSDASRETENAAAAVTITAIDAKFPLELSTIDFDDKENLVHLNDEITSGIIKTVKDYYTNDCLNDSLHTYTDTYINTIRLRDSLNTLFVILLKHYPQEEVASRVLFYDNVKKELISDPLNFKIYALFNVQNNRLKPTRLKTDFNIVEPEIQLVDFDKDGINDFKFTRLFHNGTFNTIHEAVLTIKNSRLDTLFFEEKEPETGMEK
jgi:hypothetical protein